MSFRIKTALGIVVVQVFLVSLLLISNHGHLTRTNHQQFFERASASAELLSSMVADAVVGLDLASIDAMISHTLRTNHLDYVRVRNVDGLAIAREGDPDALAHPFVEDHAIEAAKSDGRLDRAAPIMVGDRLVGQIEIGVSTAQLQSALQSSLQWNLLLAFFEITLVAALGYGLGVILTSQLSVLREGANRIGRGEFGYQLAVRGRDELAESARCFNSMSTTLADNRQELDAHRHRLQSLVAEKTRELAENAKQLEVALEAEKSLNALQRSFVSMASHEFRTPLAIIDGNARRLAREGDEAARLADKIRSAVTRMGRLINSTLAAARMDEGKIIVEPTDCDIGAILAACCERQQELSANHDLQLEASGLPATIHADPNVLDQIFTNLLSNATKYAPDAPLITVRAWRKSDDVLVTVQDRGLGMDEEDLAKLFQRFFRAKTSTGIVGTGIGLNLIKTLIERHGGDIGVVSALGEGSTFKVRLPIKAAPSDENGHSPEALSEPEKAGVAV